MSEDKKYQVFISSTYTDLIEAREKVTKVILDLYHFPVGMEMFSADDDDQWKIITDAIDVSDYYVLILGHRYGSVAEEGISYTEKEFDYAKSKGIPIISFIRNRNAAVANTERESNSIYIPKLENFVEKAKKGKMCNFWENINDLERNLAIALPKNMAKHGGIGWVRGNQASGQLAEEIAKLSEENRNLRTENEKLKQIAITKQPVLKVSINDITNLQPDEDNFLQLQWRRLREDEAYERPEKRIKSGYSPLTNKHIFLGIKNPDDFIDEYNAAIDRISDQQIEQHDHALQKYYQIEVGNSGLNIKIENIGNVIANKISIEIAIPDFILVINDASNKDIKYYKEELDKQLIPYIKTPEEKAKDRPNFIDMPHINSIHDTLTRLDRAKKTDNYLEKNVIHIEQESLLHSRGILLENYYLIPKSKNEGVIKVNIICAEYSEPSYFEIPIEVV